MAETSSKSQIGKSDRGPKVAEEEKRGNRVGPNMSLNRGLQAESHHRSWPSEGYFMVSNPWRTERTEHLYTQARRLASRTVVRSETMGGEGFQPKLAEKIANE